MKKFILAITVNLLSFFAIILLVGCIPSGDKAPRIIETQIGGQTFRIPKIYLRRPFPKPVDRSASISVMYPNFSTRTENDQALWEKGELYKVVDFSFRSSKGIKPLEESIQIQIEFNNVTKVVGDYHGLTYRTYPEGSKIKRSELWIEGNNEGLIHCSLEGERSDGKPLLPQCTYLFRWKKQSVSISIDKRLLPHWKTIKDNVIRLLGEFEVTDQPTTTSAQGE